MPRWRRRRRSRARRHTRCSAHASTRTLSPEACALTPVRPRLRHRPCARRVRSGGLPARPRPRVRRPRRRQQRRGAARPLRRARAQFRRLLLFLVGADRVRAAARRAVALKRVPGWLHFRVPRCHAPSASPLAAA
eukprot:7361447-Prymnesium_polylepis.1